MVGDLVLLTGATGFVGFRTLRYVLEHGYHVRAVVRSDAKAELVRSNPALKEATKDNLSFVVVPDFTAANAYDNILKDVKYILHIASPIPDFSNPDITDLENRFVKPAVGATMNLLDAAHVAGTVKRIVITSSIAAVVPSSVMLGQPSEEVFGPASRGDELPPPYYDNVQLAYATSKVAALARAESWVKEQKPEFDIIHLHPSYVLGRDALTRSKADFAQGSNAVLLGNILGQKAEYPANGAVVHIDEVALAHVRALDPKVPGNRSFLLSRPGGNDIQWDDAKEIVRKTFPEAIEKGLLPNDGSTATAPGKLDVSATEQILGIKNRSFEDMVKDTVGYYLEVLEAEAK